MAAVGRGRGQGDAGVRFKWRLGGRDQDKLLEKGLSYVPVAPSPLSHDGSARNLRMESMEMFIWTQSKGENKGLRVVIKATL